MMISLSEAVRTYRIGGTELRRRIEAGEIAETRELRSGVRVRLVDTDDLDAARVQRKPVVSAGEPAGRPFLEERVSAIEDSVHRLECVLEGVQAEVARCAAALDRMEANLDRWSPPLASLRNRITEFWRTVVLRLRARHKPQR